MKKKLQAIVILPAYNEAQVIGQVLDGLKKELKIFRNIEAEILVVNDGSQDETAQICQNKNVKVLTHMINRGLGGSLQTGLEYAKIKKVDLAITLDSDGQHDPQDLKKFIVPIQENRADIVIGSRFLTKSNKIPFLRQIILRVSNLVTFLFFRFYTTDSQSGFRAFSKQAIQKVRLKTQRMEVSSEIFDQIKKHHLKFLEVPIKVSYTPYYRVSRKNKRKK